jgi:hypothetical protein
LHIGLFDDCVVFFLGKGTALNFASLFPLNIYRKVSVQIILPFEFWAQTQKFFLGVKKKIY